jgi:hypothetical protein
MRTREPRGLIGAADASSRLAALAGHALTAADTSMDRLVLEVSTDPLHLLVLAGPVTAVAANGTVRVLAEPSSPASLRELRGWIGRTITDVRVEPSGALRVSFGDAQLHVPSDPAHEAWEVRGMDGGLIACLPGGSISLWIPTFGQVATAG